MTEQEAIEYLQTLANRIPLKFYTEKGLAIYDEFSQVAIEALEKQIPKKPKHPGCYDADGVFHTWNGIDGIPYDLCPCCDANLGTSGLLIRWKNPMNYCENCGQRLDWSIDDD